MPHIGYSGSAASALLAVGVLIAAAFGLGNLIVRPASQDRGCRSDSTLLRVIVGINLIGLIGALLGQTGILADGRSVWLIGLLIGAGIGFRIFDFAHRTNRRTEKPKRSDRKPEHRHDVVNAPPCRPLLGRTIVGLLPSVVALVTLGPALSYPTGWDELVYHSVLPQRWLADGSPVLYADLPYSGFPSLGEILFWLIAPIEKVIAPRLFVWVCWILGLLSLYRLLDRWFNTLTAALLTLAFTLNDTVLLISANCYVESILLMDVLALLLALSLPQYRRVSSSNWPQAAVLGILAGGAAALKLTGSAALAIPCMWYIGQLARRRNQWRLQCSRLMTYLVVAVGVFLPFYFRPWFATGNPFYPYFCEWFTSDVARLEMSRYQHAMGGFLFGVKGLIGFLNAPLLLAFRAENYDGEFGWQLLALTFLAILAVASIGRRRWRTIVLWPLANGIWFYLFWFVTAQQARFAIPYVVAIVLLAGAGLRILRRPQRRLVLMVLVAATLCSVPWHRSSYYAASWLTVVKRMSHTDYVHNITEGIYLPLVQAIHVLTPPDAKVLLLYEHRGFYLARPYLIGTPIFQPQLLTPPEKYADPKTIMNMLVEHQISYVIFAKVNPTPDQVPGWIERQQPFLDALDQLVHQRRLIPRWESDIYMLLEVAK